MLQSGCRYYTYVLYVMGQATGTLTFLAPLSGRAIKSLLNEMSRKHTTLPQYIRLVPYQ